MCAAFALPRGVLQFTQKSHVGCRSDDNHLAGPTSASQSKPAVVQRRWPGRVNMKFCVFAHKSKM
jgi:hypothetical protein